MRKVFKSGKKFIKFSAIIFFIAVLGFSNLGPGLLNNIGAPELAKQAEIKKAQAV